MKEGKSNQISKKNKGNMGSKICYILGVLIILSVIICCLPVTLPRIPGYEIYHITSGSMSPEIPVGSIVYIDATHPEDVKEGDVIAFFSGNGIVVHRVVENHAIEGTITTKGDANADVDLTDIDYNSVIGKVVCHIPFLGIMMDIVSSFAGKIYAILFAACGLMFCMLGNKLKYR